MAHLALAQENDMGFACRSDQCIITHVCVCSTVYKLGQQEKEKEDNWTS